MLLCCLSAEFSEATFHYIMVKRACYFYSQGLGLHQIANVWPVVLAYVTVIGMDFKIRGGGWRHLCWLRPSGALEQKNGALC